MVISCDIDGVLNNLAECVLKVYNEDSGDNLSVNDIKTYCIEQYVKPEYRNKIPLYFSDIRVKNILEWETDWIAKIIDNNMYELYFTTATSPKNIEDKINALIFFTMIHSIHNACFIKNYIYNHLIIMQNKQMLRTDIVIDDCIDNLQLGNDKVHNILFVKPWNIDFAYKYNATYPNNKILLCNNGQEAMVWLQKIKQAN